MFKDKIPTLSETHWLRDPFSESETFRREKKVDLHCAYNAGRMLVVMMMMNKRLIVVTWQSSRSP